MHESVEGLEDATVCVGWSAYTFTDGGGGGVQGQGGRRGSGGDMHASSPRPIPIIPVDLVVLNSSPL